MAGAPVIPIFQIGREGPDTRLKSQYIVTLIRDRSLPPAWGVRVKPLSFLVLTQD